MGSDKNVYMKVQKIGNSHMLTIPRDVREASGLNVGDEVVATYVENLDIIKLKPLRNGKKPNSAIIGGFKIKGFLVIWS